MVAPTGQITELAVPGRDTAAILPYSHPTYQGGAGHCEFLHSPDCPITECHHSPDACFLYSTYQSLMDRYRIERAVYRNQKGRGIEPNPKPVKPTPMSALLEILAEVPYSEGRELILLRMGFNGDPEQNAELIRSLEEVCTDDTQREIVSAIKIFNGEEVLFGSRDYFQN